MKKVEIYTSPLCGYCSAAKRLLNSEGLSFEEYDVMVEPERRKEMLARSAGSRTVPQIFIDGMHIGGFDELSRLDLNGFHQSSTTSD